MSAKHYILKIDSYSGDESSLMVNASGSETMFVVLSVGGNSADIVDWGYATVDELLEAWNNVVFENVEEYRQMICHNHPSGDPRRVPSTLPCPVGRIESNMKGSNT